jgi:hypothetical protein
MPENMFSVASFAAPLQRQQQTQAVNALAQALPTFAQMGVPQEVQYNALAQNGGPTRAAAGQVGDWLRENTQGKIRDMPISENLRNALSFLPELGVEVEVFSGGQSPAGSGGKRTGSTRHDHGEAADVFFYKDGRKLDWNNPDDLPIFQEIVRRGRASGLTGFGAGPGYMQPGSMHIGFGAPAVWGAGGKGANAPDWLREAFNSTPPKRNDMLASLGL